MSERPRIVRTPGVCGGQPRIDGTRFPTRRLVIAFLAYGREEFHHDYPSISDAMIDAALAYERHWWRRAEVWFDAVRYAVAGGWHLYREERGR